MEAEMETETDEEQVSPRFEIERIEKCPAPKGVPGENWYQYIVGQKGSQITGYKSGTLNSVTQHVMEFIEGLNERVAKGYSPSARASRPRKPTT